MGVRPVDPEGGDEEGRWPVDRVEAKGGNARQVTPTGGDEDAQETVERVIGGA